MTAEPPLLDKFHESKIPEQALLLQKLPQMSFGAENFSWFHSGQDQILPPSFNTSAFSVPYNKNIYKDSETDPVEIDYSHTNANQASKERRRIACVRAKVHKIRMLHGKVLAKRRCMRELHKKMKQKQEEELQERVVLMQAINTFCAHIETQSDSKTIEASHEQLQLTTDEYMELERKYSEEQNETQQREIDLDIAIDRLSELLDGPGIADQEAVGNQSAGFMDEDTDSDDETPFSKTMHPLLIEYFERAGDMEIYEERVRDIYQEYHEALQKREVRSRVNLPLDKESQEILDSYEDKHTKAEGQLDDAINEANRLQKLCEEEGLIGEQKFEDNIAYFDPDYDDDDDDDNSKAIKLRTKLNAVARESEQKLQPKDPLKAGMDEDTHLFFLPEKSSASPSGKFDRFTFINKWLLHQLRHSWLEISRLKARPELQHLVMHDTNDIAISQQALKFWYFDYVEMAEAPVSPPITENVPSAEYLDRHGPTGG